jgi:carnitine 3-dehydrogenase
MGPFLTYRIAGGTAGMRHFMEQFGPALQLPWTRLTDVPELTDELLDKVVAQSDAQADGLDVRALERLRDDCLVSIVQGLRAHDVGAGAALADHERALFALAPDAATEDGAGAGEAAPLRLHTAVVAPDWIDYNGHAHESRYLQVFGDTTDALLRHVGLDLDAGSSYFTVETHLSHLGQARAGDRLSTTTQLLGHDDKRLHVFHALHRTDDGALLATAEQMLLHVDTRAERTSPAPPELLARIDRIARAHEGLPRPERAGRAIGIPGG